MKGICFGARWEERGDIHLALVLPRGSRDPPVRVSVDLHADTEAEGRYLDLGFG